MATIKEIAKLANVSIATVSNVLNQKPRDSTSPQKVEKVLKVAKSLNYRPNYLAQSLKRQRSRSIGIIAEDLTVLRPLRLSMALRSTARNMITKHFWPI